MTSLLQPATDRVSASIVRPAAVCVLVALVWAGLAVWHPTVTYHLGPALVAASWPLTVRATHGPRPTKLSIAPVAAGMAVALLTTAALAGVDALRGPVLVGGNATVESVLFALGGAAWGWPTLARVKPGLVVRAFASRDV